MVLSNNQMIKPKMVLLNNQMKEKTKMVLSNNQMLPLWLYQITKNTIKETNKTYISVPVHRWLDKTTNKSGNMHRGLHTKTKLASERLSL